MLLGLTLALPLRAVGEPSDDELSKLMVGAWRSPRHDYIYLSDGTWWMGKKEPGILHGRWRIRNRRLETSSTYADEKGPEPGESSDPIKKLTPDEIIFGAGYKMTRIDLSEVDKPR